MWPLIHTSEVAELLIVQLIRVGGWQWLAEQTADYTNDMLTDLGRGPTFEELLEYWEWLAYGPEHDL